MDMFGRVRYCGAASSACFGVSLLLLASCTETGGTWQNADVPEEQWSVDSSQCRSRAQADVEREFALRQQTGSSMTYNPSAQWSREMNRFSGDQRVNELFAQCMRQRGYTLVTPKDAEKQR
jgi:hypothetical protein